MLSRNRQNKRDGNLAEPVAEAYHGAIDFGELTRRGIEPDRVIDFSTNVNPFGPSPRVREAVCKAVLDRYPDRDCLQLRQVISAYERVAIERILVGNGSSELLQSFAQLFLQPGDEALIVGPTYAEYERASRLAGARIEHCRAVPEQRFATPFESVESSLRRQPKVAFICNPNNPTGQWIDRRVLSSWIMSYTDTQFIIDESYIEFTDAAVSITKEQHPNLSVLRSMTKSYALAGLRLGYAIADPQVIHHLRQRRVPWSVSSPAQAAGIAAIEDQAYLHCCLTQLQEAKYELLSKLVSRRFEIVPSAANFFLLRVDDACATRERLLAQHLLVRDCTSFGLPTHVRIAVRNRDENSLLLAAL